ncbi:hypothetical protein, partial [Streptomyces griseorubiginosus]|uniref:hypothetical protein n=1 Tax=Streptomyces griseorubiginosus TaxID=67304 RepID=UPI0027E34564
MRLTIRELTLPVWRTLPWRALGAAAGLGLLLAGALRWGGGDAHGWPALVLLRTAVLAYALGLTFLLDDPARHTTATVPTRRALRTGLRIALVTPPTALWWTAVVLLVPSGVRPPVGDVTLEAAAACVLALLAGASALRWTNEPRPGPSVAAAYLLTAVVAPPCSPPAGSCSCGRRTATGARHTSGGRGCWRGRWWRWRCLLRSPCADGACCHDAGRPSARPAFEDEALRAEWGSG